MDNKKRINILLSSLFIIIIVVLAVILINPVKKPNQYVYNGFVVSKFRIESAPNVVFHNIDLLIGNKIYPVPFRSDPRDIENIVVENLDEISWLKKSSESDNYNILANAVYLTFDPEKYSGGDLGIAGGEIVKIIGASSSGIYKIPTSGAFTKPLEGSDKLVKTCEDSNKDTGIILLTLGDENKVYAEEDCIIIKGADYPNLIKSADRFLLSLLGIMP